jgi:transposase-like protein
MALVKHDIGSLLAYDEPGKLEVKQQFVELRAKGYSYRKIARKLDVSIGTLSNWSQELEGEIATLKAEELDALYERYYMTKQQKITQLGRQLKAIQQELRSRDYSDIPTEKLLDMELKVYEALEEEKVELRPLSRQEIEELRIETL